MGGGKTEPFELVRMVGPENIEDGKIPWWDRK
jgi:hypothetical protein